MERLPEPKPVFVDGHHGAIVAWLYLSMPHGSKELHAVVRLADGDGPALEEAVPIWRFKMRREECRN